MPIDRVPKESLVNVDEKGRVVLPKGIRRAGLYAAELRDNNEIVLRPRVAVDPREVISKKTLAVLDESMKNLAKGKAGQPIDLSAFSGKDNVDEQEATTKQEKPRRR